MPSFLRTLTKEHYDQAARDQVESLVELVRAGERARIVAALESGDPVPELDGLLVAAQQRAVDCAFGYSKLPLADQLRIDRVARQRADLRGV